jgi:hypothetical protein
LFCFHTGEREGEREGQRDERVEKKREREREDGTQSFMHAKQILYH